MNLTILRFDTIESTNTEALNQAARGADEGLCVVARQQTAGRGRHGRVWISPEDAGLYFSVVLRPRIGMRFFPLVTLMTAIAIHDALETLYKFECDIKWVNDIHVHSKKICGILAESTETKNGAAIVVGIVINLKSSIFSPEIEKIATSIEAETKESPDTEILLQSLTANLSRYYDLLLGEAGTEKIRQEWTRRSSYAFGKQVKVKTETETVRGTTRGIETDGALLIETENGEIRAVRAGEVENLRSV